MRFFAPWPAVATNPCRCNPSRNAYVTLSFPRAILQSIEEELRPDAFDTKTSPPASATTATPAGPILVASPAVSEPVEETADPNDTPRPTRSVTRLPADREKNVNSKHFQRPRFQSTPASRRDRKSQVASSSSSSFMGKSWSKESNQLERAGLTMGANVNARSVGTVVAHFPTAVATKSAARRKKATKRASGV